MAYTQDAHEHNFLELVQRYIKQKDDSTAGDILSKLRLVVKNTFNYLINKSSNAIISDIMLKKEAVEAVSNACWIALTSEGFVNEFEHWGKRRLASKYPPVKHIDSSSMFDRYVGNLAARTIYRLSKDEFSDLYSLFGRKRTIHYLEDLKVQVSSSALFKSAKKRGATSVATVDADEPYDPPANILDEHNAFIMQAYHMIENPGYRDVLFKYDIKGIPLTEIAAEKDMDCAVIRQWHKRALEALRKNLDMILSGAWGKHYFNAVEKLRESYSKMGEPFTFRTKLLDTDTRGDLIKDSLNKLITDGTFPPPDTLDFPITEESSFEEIIKSLRTFPFMDDRLLVDKHFRESLYIELRKNRAKAENVRYIYLQTLKYHHQQLLWALYETFKESAEMSPVDSEPLLSVNTEQ